VRYFYAAAHPERISGRPKSGSAVKTDIF